MAKDLDPNRVNFRQRVREELAKPPEPEYVLPPVQAAADPADQVPSPCGCDLAKQINERRDQLASEKQAARDRARKPR